MIAARVRDKRVEPELRLQGLRSGFPLDPNWGKALLLELANDQTEPDELLDMVGMWLLDLIDASVVGDFDLRDVVDRVADVLYEPEPPDGPSR